MSNSIIQIGTKADPIETDYPNIYVAIPVDGQSCQHTGLKHAHLYKLLGAGGDARDFVRVVNLRNPKARHGKTLFHVGDMLRFLDHLAHKQGSGAKRLRLQPPTDRDPRESPRPMGP